MNTLQEKPATVSDQGLNNSYKAQRQAIREERTAMLLRVLHLVETAPDDKTLDSLALLSEQLLPEGDERAGLYNIFERGRLHDAIKTRRAELGGTVSVGVPEEQNTPPDKTSLTPVETEDSLPCPPRSLEGFLCLLTPREKQNELKGQLNEAYVEWEEQYGERFARVLYFKEACRSFVPVLKRGAEWFAKYKIAHFLGEIIGRFSQH